MQENAQITIIPGGLKILAPAKINLSLLISGKRPDGFHELETIMTKVTLYDELVIEKTAYDKIEVVCTGNEWGPDGKNNLVHKACEKIFQMSKSSHGVKITINKNIPAGAGLGSASTDAAAALIGVNKLFELGVSRGQLREIGGQLGSDLVFFLGDPMAYCTGRGEKIQKIKKEFKFSAILAIPDVNCSTAKVYNNYRHDIQVYLRLRDRIWPEFQKNNIALIAKMCANMLQKCSFELYPKLAEVKAQIESLDIRPLCMSGSGSSMYYILDTEQWGQAEEYLRKITEYAECKCFLIRNNRW